MSDDHPAPLVPPEVDLRDFPFMPVDIRRLLTSETWLTATGDEKAAAMTLWLESWHQVPAGSLPDNDRMLAVLSQAGARWTKVKAQALRGWVKCSDGRLYHPVVAEKALEAWAAKLKRRAKRNADAQRLQRWRERTRNAAEARAGNDDEMPVKRGRNAFRNASVAEREGQGQGQGQGEEAVAATCSDDAARAMIATFDRVRVAVWGEAQARPWPHATDLATARNWLAQGADTALVEAALTPAMQSMRRRGRPPPASLSGMSLTVADALAALRTPMPQGRNHGTGPDPHSGVTDPFAIARQRRLAQRGAGEGDDDHDL